MAFSGIDGDITVSKNTASTSGSAIYFWGGMMGATTITNNTITGGAGSAVSIQNGGTTYGGPNTGTFTIANNNFSGNSRSLKIGGDASEPLGSGAVVVLNGNNISGNTMTAVADNSTSGVNVDATRNYWSSAAGPVIGTDIQGAGDADASFSPWYTTPR